jgi:mono/diheme cytochrome c family protein
VTRKLLRVAAVLLLVFLALQLVPYGWTKTNPPVTAAAPWPNEQAESVARTSCYACHSNETEWPAYSYVAPMSWLVRNDVEGGREEMNFSEWDEDSADTAEDSEDEIVEGRMPLPNYRRIHRDAQLSDQEAAVLIDALEQMSDSFDDG